MCLIQSQYTMTCCPLVSIKLYCNTAMTMIYEFACVKAELNSCNRDCMTPSVEQIHYLALTKKINLCCLVWIIYVTIETVWTPLCSEESGVTDFGSSMCPSEQRMVLIGGVMIMSEDGCPTFLRHGDQELN